MLVHPEPVTLASFARTQGPIGQVSSKVYEGLLTYDEIMRPLPGLAQEWAVRNDATVFQFRLTDDAAFHDGEPFTSQDVAFSFLDVLRKMHPRGRTTLKTLQHIDTPSDQIAIFYFSDPHPYFLSTLAAIEAPILSHRIKSPKALKVYADAEHPNGTGPYRFTDWSRGKQVMLERNPHSRDWSRETPAGVCFLVEDNAASRTEMILDGTADVGGMGTISWSAATRLSRHDDIEVTTVGASALNPVLVLDMNTTRAPLDDLDVRKALAGTICKSTLIDKAFLGYGKPMSGPVHSNWHQAGIVARPVGGSVPEQQVTTKMLRGMKLTIDVIPYGDEWVASAELIREMLSDHGVKATLRLEDFSSWMERVFVRRDFDVSLNYLHYYSDPALSLSRLHHSRMANAKITFGNSSGWSSGQTDNLLEAAAIEPCRGKRAVYYRDLERALRFAVPSVWLAEVTPITAIRKSYKHLVSAPFGVYGSMHCAK